MKRVLPFILIALISASSWAAFSYPKTPNSKMTVGKICDQRDPDFEGFRYANRVAYCRRNVSSNLKSAIKNNYGVPQSDFDQYIIDHLIPLSIGGSNHVSNLWPEHKCMTTSRTQWEDGLFQQVSSGRLTQDQAIREALKIKFDPTIKYTYCK